MKYYILPNVDQEVIQVKLHYMGKNNGDEMSLPNQPHRPGAVGVLHGNCRKHLLPNLVFGFIPYGVGMLFPHLVFFLIFGALSIAAGAGDYLNVFNAAVQVPAGAKIYMYGFHSYWYMP